MSIVSRDRLQHLAIGAYAAAILLMVVARFNGINDVIHPFLQKATDPSLYALHPNLSQSLVAGSSYVFGLVERFRLDLTQPAFIVPTYIVTCLFSGAAVYLILRNILGISSPLLRLFLLFSALFADGKLINLNKSSWILDHNFSFTFLAASLRFWFIYFCLSGRMVAMGLVLVPINILSFKVGWPISLMAFALLAYRRERSPLPWGVVALSLVAPAMAALHAPTFVPAAEGAQIFDIVKMIHASEDNPFLGPPLQWLLFPAGCAWAWHLSNRYDADIRDAMRIILLVSLLIFGLGGIVLTVDAFPLKLPLAVLLSPARALETAGFIAYMLALVWALTTPGLKILQRCALLLGLMLLKLTPGLLWVGMAAALLLVAGLLRWPRLARFDRAGDPAGAAAVLALLALPISLFFAFNLAGNRAQQRHDPIIGFHDHRITPDAMDMLRQIAVEKPDRRIFFDVAGQPGAGTHWNNLARKSGIDGDPYYLPRLDDIRRQQANNLLYDAVLAELDTGQVAPALSSALARQNVSLVVPVASAGAVLGWRIVRHYGSWVEMAGPANQPNRPVT